IDFYTSSIHLQSEDKKAFNLHTDSFRDSAITTSTTTAEAGETVRAKKLDSEDIARTVVERGLPSPDHLPPDYYNPESSSPPKMTSNVSLTESVQSASHSCSRLRPSRVQSVVSSQGSLDSDMQGKFLQHLNYS
ncbi:hypothetical protein ILYODFUR_034296, partial [Ilyodon furcidens]